MRAVVIGLGSMGCRRCRLLAKYDNRIEVFGVDMREDRGANAEREFGIKTYKSLDEAFVAIERIDAAFVCSSPLSHAKIINACLLRGIHVFTEINLTDEMYDENMMLAGEKGLVLFLSSTPLYRREIEFIKKAATSSKYSKSYIYHVGQYLPDWHPWEDYKDFFVGDKRTNGCRELMAIEFPWIFEVFGEPIEWKAYSLNSTSLSIDYPDTYQIMIKHIGKDCGLLQFDVTSRKAVRNFECSAEDLYISWDGTPNGLTYFDLEKKKDVPVHLYEEVDKRREYSASIIEDAYLSEIAEFMDVMGGKCTSRHTFEQDRKILQLIDEIGV